MVPRLRKLHPAMKTTAASRIDLPLGRALVPEGFRDRLGESDVPTWGEAHRDELAQLEQAFRAVAVGRSQKEKAKEAPPPSAI